MMLRWSKGADKTVLSLLIVADQLGSCRGGACDSLNLEKEKAERLLKWWWREIN